MEDINDLFKSLLNNNTEGDILSDLESALNSMLKTEKKEEKKKKDEIETLSEEVNEIKIEEGENELPPEIDPVAMVLKSIKDMSK